MRTLNAVLLIALLVSGSFMVAEATGRAAPDPWTPHPGSGSPATHGPATVTEGDVVFDQDEDGEWHASQTITITNDLGGADHVQLAALTQIGSIRVAHASEHDPRSDPHGYAIVTTLRGQGEDQEEARAALDRWELSHVDRLQTGGLNLAVEAAPSTQPDALASYLGEETSLLAPAIEILLPPGPLHEVRLNTTGAGSIEAEGAFPTLEATTDIGSIEALIEPWIDGSITLASQVGSVELELVGTERNGYDAYAAGGVGGVELDIVDAEPVPPSNPIAPGYASQEAARTTDLDDRLTRSTISASSRVGSVTVEAHDEGPAWRGQLEPAPASATEAQGRETSELAPELRSVGRTAMAIGLTSALLAGLVALRQHLKLGVLALYSRIRDRDVLNDPTRRAIATVIGDRPGIHFRALARELGAGHGQLDHHLTKLTEAGVLEVHPTPGRVCYFLAGQVSPDEREPLALLQAAGLRAVLEAAADSPGAAIHELAETAGLATTTVSEHVSSLADRGLVMAERDGRTRRVRVTGLAERVLGQLQG